MSNNLFVKSGNTFSITTRDAVNLHETLPPQNYVIQQSLKGFYLQEIDNFEMPLKCYGDLHEKAKRILTTFCHRTSTTGIMLSGEKGSGKSLLAKLISYSAAKQDIPTLIVNQPFSGDEFNSFLQSIEQPCIIVFDEFEKVYDKESQEHILTLLDGVFSSKKLFILTANDKWKLDINMQNRPGRIFYMLEFRGINKEFVIEYCNDNLINKKYINKIGAISGLFQIFNFDMLKALVEEMNRYDESPEDALKILNVKHEYDNGAGNFDFELFIEGESIPKSLIYQKQWVGNPIKSYIQIDYLKKKGTNKYINIVFTSEDFEGYENNSFTFKKDSGETIVLTKILAPVRTNYYEDL